MKWRWLKQFKTVLFVKVCTMLRHSVLCFFVWLFFSNWNSVALLRSYYLVKQYLRLLFVSNYSFFNFNQLPSNCMLTTRILWFLLYFRMFWVKLLYVKWLRCQWLWRPSFIRRVWSTWPVYLILSPAICSFSVFFFVYLKLY